MCKDTSVVAVGATGPSGVTPVVVVNLVTGIEFVKVIVRQSPIFARSTNGRGRLSDFRRLLAVSTSLLSAKINPSGIAAPRRLSMIGCGIAITSALIVRLHTGAGAGEAGFAFALSTFASTG